MFLTEAMAMLVMDHLVACACAFVIVFVHLDDALGDVPAAELRDLLGGDGVVVPRMFAAFDDHEEFFPRVVGSVFDE